LLKGEQIKLRATVVDATNGLPIGQYAVRFYKVDQAELGNVWERLTA